MGHVNSSQAERNVSQPDVSLDFETDANMVNSNIHNSDVHNTTCPPNNDIGK